MNKNNIQPTQSIPLFRRKRSYLFILLSLLLLALYLRIPSSSAPFSNNPQRQTKNLIHAKGPLRKPTAALEKLALQQGVLRPIDPNGKDLTQDKENTQTISTSENLYLLFGALKKKDWNLNEGDDGIIQPKDQKEMVKALGRLGLDKKLFKSSRQSWLSQQRSSNPLTVFSKSYCPYSKKAKSLLSSMGAKFQVYEVDQREDAALLQPLLAKLANGHRTFPTIFFQDTLIGGWDDLESLKESGDENLRKLLKNAGAI